MKLHFLLQHSGLAVGGNGADDIYWRMLRIRSGCRASSFDFSLLLSSM